MVYGTVQNTRRSVPYIEYMFNVALYAHTPVHSLKLIVVVVVVVWTLFEIHAHTITEHNIPHSLLYSTNLKARNHER